MFDYFRITTWLPSRYMFKKWTDWFTSHNIPWCITYDGRRKKYALWRKGVEHTDEYKEPNSEQLMGKIVESWNWDEKDDGQ